MFLFELNADRINLYIFFLEKRQIKSIKLWNFKIECNVEKMRPREKKGSLWDEDIRSYGYLVVISFIHSFFLLRAFYCISPGVGIACQCKLAESFNCCNIFSYHLWRMSAMVPWRWCGFLNFLSFICSMMLYLLLSIYNL